MKDAEKELEDEFDEDGLNENPGGGGVEEKKKAPTHDLNKHELINWRAQASINDVTKYCIGEFEQSYSFNMYLDDRAKKDAKFVNPLN